MSSTYRMYAALSMQAVTVLADRVLEDAPFRQLCEGHMGWRRDGLQRADSLPGASLSQSP